MRITVYGQARPQGSPRALVGRNGRAFVTEDTRGARGYRSWRQQVSREMLEVAPKEPVDGPIGVALVVYVPRPKSHFGTGKNASALKPNAPAHPATGIDLDKIARAVLDAGTGVWWTDDKRVASLSVVRRYADGSPERIEVEAAPLLDVAPVRSGNNP